MGEVDRGYTPSDEAGPQTPEELLALEGFTRQVQEGLGPMHYDEEGLPIVSDLQLRDEFGDEPHIIRGEE